MLYPKTRPSLDPILIIYNLGKSSGGIFDSDNEIYLSEGSFGTRCLAFHPNDLFKDMNCETIYKDEDIEVETYEQRHKRRNTIRY